MGLSRERERERYKERSGGPEPEIVRQRRWSFEFDATLGGMDSLEDETKSRVTESTISL